MHYERFALFDSADEADLALRELSARPELEGGYSVALHRDRIEGESSDPALAPDEWSTRPGMRFGAVLGALMAGVLHVFIKGPFGVLGVDARMGILLAALVGAVIGGFIGAIVGSAFGDPNLEELAAHLKQGRVLASVNVDGFRRLQQIERVFRRHQAKLKRRAII